MQIEFIDRKLEEIEADVEIILVVNKDFDHRFIDEALKSSLSELSFRGEQDEVALLPESKKLFVGCNSLISKDVRSAVAVAVRALLDRKYKSAKVATYSKYNRCTATVRAQAEGVVLGSYYYNRYKKESKVELNNIYISSEPYDKAPSIEATQKAIKNGKDIAFSVNSVRDIVNTPPQDFYPKSMAKKAKEIAKKYNLEVNILKRKDIKKEGMNALLAVARASSKSPRVIHIAYKPENPTKKVALIGKGLTYDSGGLSLKPSEFMVTMKLDKSGGAAVLGIIEAVAKLKLPIEVHGFIGAVENMIGGNAYKPDDVLTTKSGKTIEVKNTDAEGRIVLADMLAYAQEKIDADFYIDLATLTGACVVGLGQYTIGVMGNNSDLIDKFKFASNVSAGEASAHLPFNRHLRKTLKSNIADICNISNTRYGGAITAGMFLDFFINEENKDKWLHLDIAGPAFVEHDWAENTSGASGAGVRSVTRFIEKLVDKKH